MVDNGALLFRTYEAAAEVQKILLENGYCVVFSKEKSLWRLDWAWDDHSYVVPIDDDCEWHSFIDYQPEIDWIKEGEA